MVTYAGMRNPSDQLGSIWTQMTIQIWDLETMQAFTSIESMLCAFWTDHPKVKK